MGRALFGIIGRKGRVGGFVSLVSKALAQPEYSAENCKALSSGGEAGIPGVGVKSVDIRKNTGGEGELLSMD